MRPDASEVDALLPLTACLPHTPVRRINTLARAGKIPGALRVGRVWHISRSAYERWIGARAGDGQVLEHAPTVDEAAADLRRRGVLP